MHPNFCDFMNEFCIGLHKNEDEFAPALSRMDVVCLRVHPHSYVMEAECVTGHGSDSKINMEMGMSLGVCFVSNKEGSEHETDNGHEFDKDIH